MTSKRRNTFSQEAGGIFVAHDEDIGDIMVSEPYGLVEKLSLFSRTISLVHTLMRSELLELLHK